jgi:hypothetical protein
MVYLLLDFTCTWSGGMNELANDLNVTAAGCSILKSLIDNAVLANSPPWTGYGSPIIKAILNVLWLGPAIGQWALAQAQDGGPKPSDKWALSANVFFDVSGILTPLLSEPLMTSAVGEPAGVVVAKVGFYGCRHFCMEFAAREVDLRNWAAIE